MTTGDDEDWVSYCSTAGGYGSVPIFASCGAAPPLLKRLEILCIVLVARRKEICASVE